MKRMKNIRLGTLVACMCVLWGCEKRNVNIVMPQSVEPGAVCRRTFEESAGRCGVFVCYVRILPVWIKSEVCIRLEQAADTAGLKKEGFPLLPVET